MKNYKHIFSQKQSVLFIMAHPDDLEAYFGGLVTRLLGDSKNVSVAIATNGVNGLDPTLRSKNSSIRIEESQLAWEVLGGKPESIANFDFADGEIDSKVLLRKITQTIRETQPDIVCTHDPELVFSNVAELGGSFVQHIDHRLVGLAVVDAVYTYARSLNFFPELTSQDLSGWKVEELYLVADCHPAPNVRFDISSVIDIKREAMLVHKSQFTADLVDQIIREDNFRGGKYYEFGRYVKLLG